VTKSLFFAGYLFSLPFKKDFTFWNIFVTTMCSTFTFFSKSYSICLVIRS
jgi:uncharacterized membrane protein